MRRWSEWADGGDPWILLSRFGSEQLYPLELLAEPDAAWQSKREFDEAVRRLATAAPGGIAGHLEPEG